MSRLYRPETDAQRVKAMQAAKAKYDATPATQRAFGADTYTRLVDFLPPYLIEIQERGTALSQQSQAVSAINPQRRKLRLYVSHFIIGLDNAILREELPASDRAYYQLAVSGGAMPKLTTDEDLILWANNIISGEATRVTAGGTALSNPTAAQVQANLTTFQPLYDTLSARKSAYDSEQEDVAALWEEADDILSDIWDEVLFTYRKDEAPSMRRKAREYGVTYRLGTGEQPSPDEFSVDGIVTEQTTVGIPGPSVDVEVTVIENNVTVLTDIDGRYLIPTQTPGNYNLRFKKFGFKEQVLPVTIAAGQVTLLNVQMVPSFPPPPVP